MSENQERIAELEDYNAELAKEILLNESAIYQVEKEISDISSELLREPKIQFHVQLLRLIVERLEEKNKLHRKNIYQNNFEIKSLEDENK